ncbi:MAG: ornithine carbamoyltransferase [Deltaproteobacteria bacterium]
MKKDLLTIAEMSTKEINELFALTADLKKSPEKHSSALKGKSLALIFEKPSNRTYVSFQVGMFELGGNSIYLGPEQIKLGVRETIHDVAKTLSRFVDGIMLRTFGHDKVLDMAKNAGVPVINGLSDFAHPCQALADVFTIKEKYGKFKDVDVAYIGDGNNVCHSLMFCCAKVGLNINIATPAGYEPDKGMVEGALKAAKESGSRIQLFTDPKKAVKGVDVIYTDVWASMGQEQEAQKRKKDFKDFQVSKGLASLADKDYLIMHCLPAHRGEEIDDVIDSDHSIVFDQAENRLHVQKAILIKLIRG